MSPTAERILNEILTLPKQEQQELQNHLAAARQPPAIPPPQDGVLQQSIAEGRVLAPTRPLDEKQFQAWQSIEIKGKPISKTIIEERR